MEDDEAKRIDELTILQDDLESIEKDCLKLIENDEHPEWHRYDMSCSDASYEAWKILLDNGFIRIGQKGDRIHFEGRSNTLKNRMQSCKDFAENRNCTAEFEPQKEKQ